MQRLGRALGCAVFAAAVGLLDAPAHAAPPFATSTGCTTPTSNTVYYSQKLQSCGGVAVNISDTTLYNAWATDTMGTAFGCSADSAGTLRYKDQLIEFCDGSAWTNLGSGSGSGSSGSADSISSTNTTARVYTTAGGTISFTTGSVAQTAYLDSTGRYVGPGVSITTMNGISSTNGYFTGNVGIGTSAASSNLHLYESNTAEVATELLRLDNPSSNSTNNGTSIGFYQNLIQYGRIRNYYTAANDWTFNLGYGANDHLTIKSNGYVGIGTTEPSSTLHVTGVLQLGHTLPQVMWRETDGTSDNKIWKMYASTEDFQGTAVNDADSVATRWLYVRRTGTTVDSVNFENGKVGIGTATPTATLQVSGSFVVSTSAQTTTPSLYVGTNGYVGVGTSSPNATLHVNGNASAFPVTNVYSQLEVAGGGATRLSLGTLTSAVGAASIGTGFIQALVNATAFKTLALNPSGGNVGIGTTTPSGTLSVSGTVAMTRYGAAPVACGATYNGLMAMTSTAKLCACDGTSWKYPDDTGAACVW